MFHTRLLWSSFIPLNYCNLKQLESIYLLANNEIPDAVVWKCMWAGSFPRGCSDVHEGNCNVPQDSVWLCDTRMHLRCSLEMANKQPLLHIFNFRVMWIHLVPSIQARHLLRWTSRTKEKKRGKTRTNVESWMTNAGFTKVTADRNTPWMWVRSLHLTSLHWLGWLKRWRCSTLLLVMFAQLPEHRGLVHGWFFLGWGGVEIEQVAWSAGLGSWDSLVLGDVRTRGHEARASLTNTDQFQPSEMTSLHIYTGQASST